MDNTIEIQSASVRMPADLKKALRIQAALNDRTLSDEIIGRLQMSLEEKSKPKK